jgi:DNA-binding transcriptional ArsR family regulator
VVTYTQVHVLDALGEPTRRAIFERLAQEPSAVGDLAERMPVSRPAVSQHLRVLKAARLVRDQQVGTRRVYSLDPVGVRGLRDYLERFWGVQLQSFKRTAEAARDAHARRPARPAQRRGDTHD